MEKLPQIDTELLEEEQDEQLFEHFRFDVDPGQEPLRIDKYMAAHMEHTSRHRVQCAIKEGFVQVGDKTVKANYIVRPGDVIRFVMPYRRRGVEILPQDIPLNIVYEDDDVLLPSIWASPRAQTRGTTGWECWCTASTKIPAACLL